MLNIQKLHVKLTETDCIICNYLIAHKINDTWQLQCH